MFSKLSVSIACLLCIAGSAHAAQVVATWQPQQAATAYRIERTVGAGPWQPQVTLVAPITNYNQTGLSVDVEYCYRVIAINGNMEGTPSDKACATLRSPFGVVFVYIP